MYVSADLEIAAWKADDRRFLDSFWLEHAASATGNRPVHAMLARTLHVAARRLQQWSATLEANERRRRRAQLLQASEFTPRRPVRAARRHLSRVA